VRFEISHSTSYRYTQAVFFEPHVFRFRPRSNSWQHLLEYEIRISPRPARMSESIDAENNETLVGWFDTSADHLDVEARMLVETMRENPFDFIWEAERSLPVHYSESERSALAPYRSHEQDALLWTYAEEVRDAACGDAQAFLVRLNEGIHETCRYVRRPEGEPRAPEETLRRGEGACRDLAVLYIAMAREMGFAARFVSGYAGTAVADKHELHAWAEVYMPGGGWRGFDPSSGLAVADQHVAVAAGATPRAAAPVTGSFRGQARALPVESNIDLRRLTDQH
jgi:transglutaminase-like putative cysteine protease